MTLRDPLFDTLSVRCFVKPDRPKVKWCVLRSLGWPPDTPKPFGSQKQARTQKA